MSFILSFTIVVILLVVAAYVSLIRNIVSRDIRKNWPVILIAIGGVLHATVTLLLIRGMVPAYVRDSLRLLGFMQVLSLVMLGHLHLGRAR